MGAIEGSITFRTFFVDGQPPKGFRDAYLECLRKEAFSPLSHEGDEERRMGWVAIQHPLDSAFADPGEVFFNEYLCLGLRIDRWSIPSALLKAHIAEAVIVHKEKHDKERVGRRERADIKREVVTDLKQKLLPSMKVVDMVWHLESQAVRFWSHSNSLGEEFCALFEQTFGLTLVPDSPYTSAMALEVEDEDLQIFTGLEPESFATKVVPVGAADYDPTGDDPDEP